MNRNEPAAGAEAPCGVLLLDKPAGPSSHDMVSRARRRLGVKKVGHGGTLDPFATGLLLLLVGRATRLFDYFMPLPKEYLVTVQFGAVSDTCDSEGEITPVTGSVSESALDAALAGFRGEISQRVPAYSAVKVGGEPLYRKARRGEDPAGPTRTVTIHDISVEGFDHERQQARLRVACSRGTYIRQLAADIGESVGSGAYAAGLRRIAVGDFRVEAALAPEALESPAAPIPPPGAAPPFLSCLSALYFLPVRQIEESMRRDVLNGRPLAGSAAGPVRIACGQRLLAVYGPGDREGSLVPLVVLP